MRPPSLGARVLARFLDGAVVSVVVAVVISLVGGGDLARAVLATLLGVGYDAVAVATWGRTLGKRSCGIVVIDVRGAAPSWRQAAIRSVVLLLPISLLAPRTDSIGEWAVLTVVLANFVVVARRREDRRGLHDLAAGTRPIVGT